MATGMAYTVRGARTLEMAGDGELLSIQSIWRRQPVSLAMKRMLALLSVYALLGASSIAAGEAQAAAAPAPARPNILLIFTDDHGWADLGAQGVDKDIRTPNLDRLARDGVLFKRGYVTAPQCTPSRAGIITGMYQQRLGVEHNGIPKPSEVVTLPERLKGAGYVSGISGKWHLNVVDLGKADRPRKKFDPELLPHRQGFDEYFTGFRQDYAASHALDGSPFPDAPRQVHEDGFRVATQTEAALGFLDRRATNPDQPWFLYLSYMAPHVPLESPEPWFSRTAAYLPQERRQALALLGAIDDGVGRIRERIRAMGQEQNTLVFFIGDNGAPLGRAWNGSINLPMKGQKGMLSEGGIRVPFVAAWPGKIPGGQVYDHPVISLDVAATAVELAGLPKDPALDGVNLVPFLTRDNGGVPHDTLYWRWMSQAAVLEMPYKLIVLGERERLLFNVTEPDGEDIGRNLMAQQPDIAARLEDKLKGWTRDLQPPGLSATPHRRHERLFAEHGISAGTEAAAQTSARPAPEAQVSGWRSRNGTLALRDGALVIAPDPNAGSKTRLFITHSDLDLAGPVRLVMRVRAEQGGKSVVNWRTKGAAGFERENTAAFDWPASAEWQDVQAELPVQGRLTHLRIVPAKASAGLEVQSIELHDKDGAQTWRYDAAQ